MNGPQHYARSEEITANVEALALTLDGRSLNAVEMSGAHASLASGAALAQVHATLALVAVQVDAHQLDAQDRNGTDVVTDWGKAVQKS